MGWRFSGGVGRLDGVVIADQQRELFDDRANLIELAAEILARGQDVVATPRFRNQPRAGANAQRAEDAARAIGNRDRLADMERRAARRRSIGGKVAGRIGATSSLRAR